MHYTEKMDRRKELIGFFKKSLSGDIVESIMYISIRKKSAWKNSFILVGVKDLKTKEEIIAHSKDIINDSQEYITKCGQQPYDSWCIIKKIEVFNFEPQKAKMWKSDPYSFFKYLVLGCNQYVCDSYMIYNGYVMPFSKSFNDYRELRQNTYYAAVLFGFYDFIATDRCLNNFKYLKVKIRNRICYIKYIADCEKPKIGFGGIGKITLSHPGIGSKLSEITRVTFEKWRKISTGIEGSKDIEPQIDIDKAISLDSLFIQSVWMKGLPRSSAEALGKLKKAYLKENTSESKDYGP